VRKLLFFILLIALLPVSLLAQQKTKIYLVNSEHAILMNKTKVSYIRKPVFKQDNAILTCDSAVFYEEKNVFEAYNNVHINQADTVNIYSDFLTYDGNTKMAHLTSNVRLLDRESVLTTNILDYNMATKVGTYITGGKIVNKDVTLTSKNGYYFAGSRDAYFRYNVVAVTPQTTIKSDTLRYNTLTNWTYFYGPTNILGKDDNLYTENGAYNTKTQYAYFGKKNLYTSGSRSLKGDSLYYDGAAGYGKAVRNIVFRDTTDKTVMYGQLGYYYKIDQRTLVTKNAYVGLGTSDSITVKNIKRPDSLWMGADTLETQVVLRQLLKLLPLPIIKKDNEVGEEKPKNKAPTEKGAAGLPSTARPAQSVSVQKKSPPKKGGIKLYKSTEQTIEQVEKLSGLLVFKSTASLKKAVLKKDSVHTDGKKPGLPKIVASGQKTAIKTLALKDTIKINPLDTVKARIIKAYHKVRVFKTNMQAKADSLFYTSADSTLRWYYHPILWSDGSQQTGDTLYVHMRNKKINAVQVLQNAFTVNVYKDSTKFNQIKGRLMTGFFKDGKLNTMYVDGNAESAYFTKTDKGDYDKMNRTISSRIKIIFKENEIYEIVPIKDVEGTTTPVAEVKEEVLLTGFIWKPELRPLSKADIIRPIVRKPKAPDPKKTTIKDKVVSEVAKQAGKVPDGVKKEVKETVKKALSDSTLKVPAVIPPQQVKPDSTAKPAPLKKQ